MSQMHTDRLTDMHTYRMLHIEEEFPDLSYDFDKPIPADSAYHIPYYIAKSGLYSMQEYLEGDFYQDDQGNIIYPPELSFLPIPNK
jgi:hypothetical protein